MMSPTDVEPDFRTWAGLSNLDRCNRCGSLRSAHGADWACPPASQRGVPIVLVIIGSLLAGVGGTLLALAGATGTMAPGTLGASSFLIGVSLIVSGAVIARRPG
jgi:hypothetical protein